jgi:hypothetical protein
MELAILFRENFIRIVRKLFTDYATVNTSGENLAV